MWATNMLEILLQLKKNINSRKDLKLSLRPKSALFFLMWMYGDTVISLEHYRTFCNLLAD